MAYTPLDCESIKDARLQEVFHHADMYLSDAYGMFRALPPKDGDGGGGNFSIALVLLCVIDGLATEIWPGRTRGDQEQRFKKLIRSRLHWGTEGKGKWLYRGVAADQLYVEFRNPLVHELAQDKVGSSRPARFVEPIIGRWGRIPVHMRDISKIDALSQWDDGWPILYEQPGLGGSGLKLAVAALYWAVKQLAKDMAAGDR